MRQYVLKVHSRCDLACDHCYMYEHADQSWRTRPLWMSAETVRAAAMRIAEHAAAHETNRVSVVLHGGEPLLLGVERMRAVLSQLSQTIRNVAEADFSVQTNGLQLTERMCELFVEFGVRVGVSLDGDAFANDRHRRFRDGASSHAQVLKALELLRRPDFRQIYGGILCTVDVANDPVAVYDALAREHPPRIDFLLPHATWDSPPARPVGQQAPYAAWLKQVRQRWQDAGRPMAIRMFDSLEALYAGGHSETESLGLDPPSVLVVETEGAWELEDSLKTAFEGAPGTGFTVFAHPVDVVMGDDAIVARQGGLESLCTTCQRCPVVRQCGGGLFAHRYRDGTGFDNPSVYCDDLKDLISTIDWRPAVPSLPTVPQAVVEQLASGYGDAAALDYLAQSQLEITYELVTEVAKKAHRQNDRVAWAAWEDLQRLEDEAPQAVSSVLRHPFVRAWAVGCLVNGAGHEDHLACLAAAASGRRVDGACPAPWQEARQVPLGGHQVSIEDSDPYRDCFGKPVAGRLDGIEEWTRQLQQAWVIIEREAPQYLDGLRGALHTIVPLRAAPDGKQSSAAARDAFGAIGVAPAPSPEALAVLVVHEVQHVKLGALLDVCDLVDPRDPVRIEVGWRKDPRPAEAALQGIYAHFAVADMWRARGVEKYFAQYRDWTAGAAAKLRLSGALTQTGDAFLDGLSRTMSGWPE